MLQSHRLPRDRPRIGRGVRRCQIRHGCRLTGRRPRGAAREGEGQGGDEARGDGEGTALHDGSFRTASAAVQTADAVITMLPANKHVQELYLSAGGQATFAVRVLGNTARVRVFEYQDGGGWAER